MFKKAVILVLFIFTSCNFERPTQFSEKALNDTVVSLDDSTYTFNEILNNYKGKKVLIDFWASWCRDCLEGLPKVKELQNQFPEVTYLFLSVDERKGSWKRGVKRYNIKGEHYNLPQGMNEGDLVDFVGLSWIPRYMILDENGKILLFKATNASDKKIVETLKTTI